MEQLVYSNTMLIFRRELRTGNADRRYLRLCWLLASLLILVEALIVWLSFWCKKSTYERRSCGSGATHASLSGITSKYPTWIERTSLTESTSCPLKSLSRSKTMTPDWDCATPSDSLLARPSTTIDANNADDPMSSKSDPHVRSEVTIPTIQIHSVNTPYQRHDSPNMHLTTSNTFILQLSCFGVTRYTDALHCMPTAPVGCALYV